jgi:hypothetical protein
MKRNSGKAGLQQHAGKHFKWVQEQELLQVSQSL